MTEETMLLQAVLLLLGFHVKQCGTHLDLSPGRSGYGGSRYLHIHGHALGAFPERSRSVHGLPNSEAWNSATHRLLELTPPTIEDRQFISVETSLHTSRRTGPVRKTVCLG